VLVQSGKYVIALGLKPTPQAFIERHSLGRFEFAHASRTLAAHFSLASQMTMARDQKALEVCATFGVVSCLEFFTHNDLSEACLTDETERELGDCQPGLHLGETMVGAKQNGVVEEQFWPFDGQHICFPSPPNISGRPRFRFSDAWLFWYRDHASLVKNMEHAATSRAVLDTGGDPVPKIKDTMTKFQVPICAALPVFFSSGAAHLNAGWDNGPDVHMPTSAMLKTWIDLAAPHTTSTGDGMHAIAICGYDDGAQRFEFKNSWGTWWGNNGFGSISYEYIRTYATEAWAGFG